MIFSIVIVAIVGVASAGHLEKYGNLQVDLGNLAMQNPDLFGGDMLGIELDADRTAIRALNYRWKWKQIPYKIVPALGTPRKAESLQIFLLRKNISIDSRIKDVPYKDLIESAMEEYHNKTCIRFVPYKHHDNYIHIFPGNGCYSHVGMMGGGQEVSLGEGCMYKGTIIHELGHVVGFFHEHMRSDRDDHIIIYWDNIREGMHNQFTKVRSRRNILLTPFDYTSIMIYDNRAFSKDGSITMEAKTGVPLLRPSQKSELSADDVIRVNKMYDCEM